MQPAVLIGPTTNQPAPMGVSPGELILINPCEHTELPKIIVRRTRTLTPDEFGRSSLRSRRLTGCWSQRRSRRACLPSPVRLVETVHHLPRFWSLCGLAAASPLMIIFDVHAELSGTGKMRKPRRSQSDLLIVGLARACARMCVTV
jgi:hypothetical protein